MGTSGAFAELAHAAGAERAAAGVESELRRRHAEPHRVYHTLDHVVHVLATIDDLTSAGEPVDDLVTLRLAAWFHDAVYDPRRTDNEARSATLAQERLTMLGVGVGRRQRVTALVLATADHAPVSADQRLFVDADLAVLAAPARDYRRYVEAVRREYAWLDEQRWRAGRAAFLRRMLQRPAIFSSATMRATAERAARDNVTAELGALGRTAGDGGLT